MPLQKFTVFLMSQEDGYQVIVPHYPNCTTEGDTVEEALANAQEAIALWLDTCDELKRPRPNPGIVSEIMRSEYVNLKELEIPEPRPGILRAQIDWLCQESRPEYNASVLSKYD